MNNKLKPNQCSRRVASDGGWHSSQCTRTKNLVDRDGKLYCKQHDPVAVEAKYKERLAEQQAKWKAEADAEEAKRLLLAKGAKYDALAAELAALRAELALTIDLDSQTLIEGVCKLSQEVTERNAELAALKAGQAKRDAETLRWLSSVLFNSGHSDEDTSNWLNAKASAIELGELQVPHE